MVGNHQFHPFINGWLQGVPGIDGVFANVRLVNLVLELHVSWRRLKLEHSELDFGKGTLQGPPETPNGQVWRNLRINREKVDCNFQKGKFTLKSLKHKKKVAPFNKIPTGVPIL